jgi:hypothetical protein
MEYQEYIDLGFERVEMKCSVEFKQTGYSGYALEKRINDKMLICSGSGELDKPKLYIKKRGTSGLDERFTIIPITTDVVRDILSENPKDTEVNPIYTAC